MRLLVQSSLMDQAFWSPAPDWLTSSRFMPRPAAAPTVLARMSPSGVSAGCTIGSPDHSCCQRMRPSAGAKLTSPDAVLEENLRNAIKLYVVWRAVASALLAEPAWFSGLGFVGCEGARCRDEHEIAGDQRRTREAPTRNVRLSVCSDIC